MLRRLLAYALAAASLAAAAFPSAVQARKAVRAAPPADLRIGIGHGIGFLPMYVAQDAKLLDKHAGGKLRITVQRFGNAAQLRQALEKDEIAVSSFGLSAFLLAREAGLNTDRELVAVSGITTLPLMLLTARRDIKSLTDFRPGDRIAVPSLSAPQMTFLRLQGEKWSSWGAWTRLRQQIVTMPHQEALDALTSGKAEIAAYFASPPFTQMALQDPKIRPVLSSVDITGGRTSFLLLAASKRTLATQPGLAEIVAKAVDEAAALIAKNPRAAAMTYLKYEPSHALDARAVEAVLRELKDEFGSGIFGVGEITTYLRGDGRLKTPPASWRDVVAPALADGAGS